MSKCYSNDTEMIVKEMRKVIGVYCDNCKRILLRPTRYFRITTGHHDWGNDSCESVECYDICLDCRDKFVLNYLKNMEPNSTEYIEVETKYAQEWFEEV